jgi:hypothetical protein
MRAVTSSLQPMTTKKRRCPSQITKRPRARHPKAHQGQDDAQTDYEGRKVGRSVAGAILVPRSQGWIKTNYKMSFKTWSTTNDGAFLDVTLTKTWRTTKRQNVAPATPQIIVLFDQSRILSSRTMTTMCRLWSDLGQEVDVPHTKAYGVVRAPSVVAWRLAWELQVVTLTAVKMRTRRCPSLSAAWSA